MKKISLTTADRQQICSDNNASIFRCRASLSWPATDNLRSWHLVDLLLYSHEEETQPLFRSAVVAALYAPFYNRRRLSPAPPFNVVRLSCLNHLQNDVGPCLPIKTFVPQVDEEKLPRVGELFENIKNAYNDYKM